MEKTIQLGEKTLRLNNNVNWFLIYRNQFGRDIVPAIMPIAASLADVISGIINETGKTENIEFTDIAGVLTGDVLIDALIHLGGAEITDLINMTWALAKCADRSIPDPETWADQFDVFPLDIIVPEVAGLVLKGVISSKNLERLETLRKKIQPALTSTPSSSPDLKEA